MRILIDDEAFIVQRYGGVSRIFSEIIKRIRVQKNVLLFFYNFYSENAYLLPLKLSQLSPFLSEYHFPLKGKILRKVCRLVSHSYTLKTIKNDCVDIFHPSYYADYYLPVLKQHKRIKLVFTVHDLIHELIFPESKANISLALKKKKNILSADHIITVSHSTKKDLLKYYPTVKEENVTVIHLAHSFDIPSCEVKNLPEQYVLFIGERRGYKNFTLFAKAFSRFRKTNTKISLVCTGNLSFSASERSLLKELDILECTIHIRCTDSELKYLYEKALMFVFPSLYEGFGIPLLEAFACNTPVIASNSSSLPEVAKDAALYFNPSDETDLLNQMQLLYNNPVVRKDLIDKGQKRLLDFSWEKHYKATLDVYYKLYMDENPSH